MVSRRATRLHLNASSIGINTTEIRVYIENSGSPAHLGVFLRENSLNSKGLKAQIFSSIQRTDLSFVFTHLSHITITYHTLRVYAALSLFRKHCISLLDDHCISKRFVSDLLIVAVYRPYEAHKLISDS